MKRERNKNKLVIILLLVIAVLLLVIAYMFIIKPAFTGYTIKAQNEGYQYALFSIMQQAIQCQQPVPLTLGNQTINIIAIECLDQARQ